MRGIGFLIGLMGILAGCNSIAPMAESAVLSAPAGTPIVITSDRYQTATFDTWYDASWTVVSSASFDESHVYFISPDEDALILIAPNTHQIDGVHPPALEPHIPLTQQTLSLSDDLSIHLITMDDRVSVYQATFQRQADSVRLPD